jgi:hypothetical protein
MDETKQVEWNCDLEQEAESSLCSVMWLCTKGDRIISIEAAINIMREGPDCDVWKMKKIIYHNITKPTDRGINICLKRQLDSY